MHIVVDTLLILETWCAYSPGFTEAECCIRQIWLNHFYGQPYQVTRAPPSQDINASIIHSGALYWVVCDGIANREERAEA